MAVHETLVILDFGSQVTYLIARRARELRVHSVILPHNAGLDEIRRLDPKGIVLSGGPGTSHQADSPKLDKRVLEIGVPVLGICYGMQIIAETLGGRTESAPEREYGKTTLNVAAKSRLLQADFDGSTIWTSNGVTVTKPPSGFTVTAMSDRVICAMEEPELGIYGLQFHPEVVHSQYGRQMIDNFLGLCGFSRDWLSGSIIQEQVKKIRAQVGDGQVICALSGGVDSSVAAAFVNKAIGQRQTCIFVDHGLLRLNEYDEVLASYKAIGLHVKPVRAAKQFLSALKGVSDPEQKRKIIGREFIKVFEREAKKLKNVQFLVQGTLYPDVIESMSVNGPSETIKSHHNVGGLPKDMRLKLVEPLRELFKDEVREAGKKLGLPDSITQRQPFPGPGLAIRIIGEVTPHLLSLLQQADSVVRSEIEAHPMRPDIWQFFAVLLPVKTVGVMGDGRTYEQVIAVRAVSSTDGMTADWARLPHDLLARISSRIVNEVRGVNRVVYDITNKPPGTIEWE